MNNHNYRNMKKTLNQMYDYWFDLQAEYGLDKENRAPFTIYTTAFYEQHHNPEVEFIRKTDIGRAFMTTIQYCLGHNDPIYDDRPENNVILDIYSQVYMSYENLFELVIDCNMNWDDVLLCLKHALRHELGHILYARNTFIGKKHAEWFKYIEEGESFHSSQPHLRKNASIENRRKFILAYMNDPHEKQANDLVGITEDDIIEDFYRKNGRRNK